MLHHGPLHAGVILDPCSGDPSHLLAQTFASPCMSSALTIPANLHRPFSASLKLAQDKMQDFRDNRMGWWDAKVRGTGQKWDGNDFQGRGEEQR